ncbi:MAG: hypothetical protein HFE26_03935 [Clostridia bacterium]|nr:hypothetical protein [Clostridia bacterium]
MEKKIGKNVSSGAKKVERVEEEKKSTLQAEAEKPAKKQTKKSAQPKKSPKQSKKTVAKKQAVKREEKAAAKRLEAAKEKAAKKEKKLIKKAELKQKKMEKKAALKAKKAEHKAELLAKKAERKQAKMEKKAALKEKKLERKAEKTARRELLKNESKAEKQKRLEREKRERTALKRQKHESREKAREQKAKAREAARERRSDGRKHKREQKTERKKNRAGYGGWLAAVISLGAACLVLATIVTAGAMRMSDMDADTANGYHATLFEMVSVSEDMDNNLSKLRVSAGANEQRKLLTEILVDSALMESALERIPVDAATSTDISSFVNKTGAYARRLLGKLASGIALDETEKLTIEYLHKISSRLYTELNTLATTMTEKEFREFLEGKEGSVSQKFGEIGNGTQEQPEETLDAPFANEGNVGTNSLNALEEVSASRAEELARDYFNAYHVKDVQFTGETVTSQAECYNFLLTDENDVEIYAQITKKGGKLAFFETYEVCTQKNFDLETCDTLAREFLTSLGMHNPEAVWLCDTGMSADITYVSNVDGVRVYADMVQVRVCESKGRVVGMDAMQYLLNYGEREFDIAIPEMDARAYLAAELVPYEVHLAYVPVDGVEMLCYEYACTYGEEEFVVYLSAMTGEEVQVYRVQDSARGRYLR